MAHPYSDLLWDKTFRELVEYERRRVAAYIANKSVELRLKLGLPDHAGY